MIVDPDRPGVDATVFSGFSGPNDITFNFTDPGVMPATQQLVPSRHAYVTNYSESTIAIVDLEPNSPTQNHVLAQARPSRPTDSTHDARALHPRDRRRRARLGGDDGLQPADDPDADAQLRPPVGRGADLRAVPPQRHHAGARRTAPTTCIRSPTARRCAPTSWPSRPRTGCPSTSSRRSGRELHSAARSRWCRSRRAASWRSSTPRSPSSSISIPSRRATAFCPSASCPSTCAPRATAASASPANTDSCDLTRVDVSTVIHSSLQSLFPDRAGRRARPPRASPQMEHQRPVDERRAARAAGAAVVDRDGAGQRLRRLAVDRTATRPAARDGFCSGGQHRAWVALPACRRHRQGAAGERRPTYPDGSTHPPCRRSSRRCASTPAASASSATSRRSSAPAECSDESRRLARCRRDRLAERHGRRHSLARRRRGRRRIAVDTEADASGVVSAGRIIIGDGYGERIDIVPFDVVHATYGTPTSVTLEPGDNGLLTPGVRVVRVGPRGRRPASSSTPWRATAPCASSISIARSSARPTPIRAGTSPAINLQQTPDLRRRRCRTRRRRRRARSAASRSAIRRRRAARRSPPRRASQLAQGQLPTDVAFVHLDAPPGNPTMTLVPPPAARACSSATSPGSSPATARGTVVNIFDACPQPNQQPSTAHAGARTPAPCVLANVPQSIKRHAWCSSATRSRCCSTSSSHRLRSGHPRFFLPTAESDSPACRACSTTPIRAPWPCRRPRRACPTAACPTPVAAAATWATCRASTSSRCRPQLLSPLSKARASTRAVYFVDPDHARNETWVLAWEGVLPGSNRTIGAPFVIADSTRPDRRLPVRLGRRLVQPRRARRRQAALPRLHRRQRVRQRRPASSACTIRAPSPT